ncbi:HAD family hydrolase [Fusibacter ferrireducens]|uniref:HAD-IA family hydrolase n=1 Tax=Fusibacter ferrireducens TaxID=2785058 RepID=A0ABR9ZPS3_9FIRM|nr:HAD-IA family hydrolase [Fusibacter ferrireducens]MBF4691981.1 HAD-IA family hydrolase [Fusibacter ferrireducens]
MTQINSRDTIIFDAGGVLFQIKAFRNSIVNRVLLSMGYDQTKIDIALERAKEIDNIYCNEADKIVSWSDEKEWLTQRYSKIVESIDPGNFELRDKLFLLAFDTFQYELYDETVDVLERLKMQYNLVVLSNATASLDWAFDLLDLRKYFSEVIISSYEKCAKPDPKLFEITLNKIKKQGHECLFIDDKVENVNTANELGILGFHLDRKHGATLRDFETMLKHL